MFGKLMKRRNYKNGQIKTKFMKHIKKNYTTKRTRKIKRNNTVSNSSITDFTHYPPPFRVNKLFKEGASICEY